MHTNLFFIYRAIASEGSFAECRAKLSAQNERRDIPALCGIMGD